MEPAFSKIDDTNCRSIGLYVSPALEINLSRVGLLNLISTSHLSSTPQTDIHSSSPCLTRWSADENTICNFQASSVILHRDGPRLGAPSVSSSSFSFSSLPTPFPSHPSSEPRPQHFEHSTDDRAVPEAFYRPTTSQLSITSTKDMGPFPADYCLPPTMPTKPS